ncbi:hypothetical protein A2U01_0044786, partial [Trifolium medium]|nr:hypothetical protein [Trifolium medium]
VVPNFSVGEKLWNYGTEFAPILEQGKLQWKMLQGKDQWILDYFMELLMVTLGLVGGAISSVVEALV